MNIFFGKMIVTINMGMNIRNISLFPRITLNNTEKVNEPFLFSGN